MARPRTIEADVISTFHCTYLLKTAITKASRTASDGNTSTYIRISLEAACRQTLGGPKWARLQHAATPSARRQLLDTFLSASDVTRLRRGIDSAVTKPVNGWPAMSLVRAVDDYLGEFEAAYNRRDTDIALCVALEEGIDTIRKIKAVIIRDDLAPKDVRLLQRLAARFPDRLRADFDAATLSRIAASKPQKKK